MSATATGDAPGASAVSVPFALSWRFFASRRADRLGVCAGGVLPPRFDEDRDVGIARVLVVVDGTLKHRTMPSVMK